MNEDFEVGKQRVDTKNLEWTRKANTQRYHVTMGQLWGSCGYQTLHRREQLRQISSFYETRGGIWHSWLQKGAHSVSKSLLERGGILHFRGNVILWEARQQHPRNRSLSESRVRNI